MTNYRPLDCFSPGQRKQDSKWAEWKGLEEEDFHAPLQTPLTPLEDEVPEIIYLNDGFGGIFRHEYQITHVDSKQSFPTILTLLKFLDAASRQETLPGTSGEPHIPFGD